MHFYCWGLNLIELDKKFIGIFLWGVDFRCDSCENILVINMKL